MIPNSQLIKIATELAGGDHDAGFVPGSTRSAASDFDFTQGGQPGQGAPVAAKVSPATAPAPAPKAATVPAPGDAALPVEHRFESFVHQLAAAGGHPIGPAPAADDSNSHPFLKRVLKSPAVKAALAVAKSEQATYRAVLKTTSPIIGKEQQALDLLTAIAACADAGELERLRHEFAQTQGPAAEAAAQSARRICRVAYSRFDVALRTLITAAISELDSIAPLIESAEVDLFDSFGFPHQKTGLMNHLDLIRNRVSHHRASLDLLATPARMNALIPGDGQEILSAFTA